MQTPEQIKVLLVANLGDKRMHGACLYVNDLIARLAPEPTVPAYRITNTLSDTLIENITQFKDAISSSNMRQVAGFFGERLSSSQPMAFAVVPTNLQLRFSIHSKEDVRFSDQQNYFANYEAVYNFSFTMNYMNDGDDLFPSKITAVRLIKVL